MGKREWLMRRFPALRRVGKIWPYTVERYVVLREWFKRGVPALRRVCKILPDTAEEKAVLGVAVIGTVVQFTLICTIGKTPRDFWLLLPSSLPMWLVTTLNHQGY